MPNMPIDHMLKRLHPELDRLDDPETRRLVSLLLNLVEEVVSETTTLRQENQALRDEINRLKGEQGKPTIKPNTRKREPVSCEQERRQAEQVEAAGGAHEGFKLDASSLEKLKEHRLPDDVLESLRCLQDRTPDVESVSLNALQHRGSPLLRHLAH